MLCPVVCFGCGYSLSEKCEIFKAIRRARIYDKIGRDKLNILPQQVPLDPDIQIVMEDVLDKLKIFKICCRARIGTYLDYRDYY
uniref:DNA-directed RNA polymerase subunit 10 homolog protein n=1 Tax=Abalone asfa-like virus TaxID=2839893 RepID=A0A5K7Y7W2_9VIRU|nr:Putative DNA-directed RNA polymerase subunit 10 homolog protein [Abalone asfa-like virus]